MSKFSSKEAFGSAASEREREAAVRAAAAARRRMESGGTLVPPILVGKAEEAGREENIGASFGSPPCEGDVCIEFKLSNN